MSIVPARESDAQGQTAIRNRLGVSLLTPATMRFRKPHGETDKDFTQLASLAPSTFFREARTDWEHSIPPLDALRYSITFRTLSGI